MTKIIVVTSLLLVSILTGCKTSTDQPQTAINRSVEREMAEQTPSTDPQIIPLSDTLAQDVITMSFESVGSLEDVTRGDVVREISTQGNARGYVQTAFQNQIFTLRATFVNLPDPNETDVYEGWLVKQSPFSFISTGKLIRSENVWTNLYQSKQDLNGYDFFVLTLEAADGNPAPGDHIVEGKIQRRTTGQ